jgi:hypothetical protein
MSIDIKINLNLSLNLPTEDSPSKGRQALNRT